MPKTIDVRVVEWAAIDKAIERFAKQLAGKKIWGVPRGGTVVAALLAFHGCIMVDVNEADVIVDDIACEGETMEIYKRTLKKPFAALWVRATCSAIPDFWDTKVEDAAYVMFPWETYEAVGELVLCGKTFRNRDGFEKRFGGHAPSCELNKTLAQVMIDGRKPKCTCGSCTDPKGEANENPV